MKLVLQRVSRAKVNVDGKTVASISRGLLVLTGLHKDDRSETLLPFRDKLLNLRIFPNEKGRFDLSLKDIEGELLLVPQFTLFADTSKGRRPEFFEAMPPSQASQLFTFFVELCQQALPGRVGSGIFGAEMQVELVNEGPVTIII